MSESRRSCAGGVVCSVRGFGSLARRRRHHIRTSRYTRVIRSAPTFRWHHVDLKSVITPQLEIPIFVENDANGAALAELSFGRRKGQSDLCLLFLDVEVGAGMIFDRRIFRGSAGLAGEIGHLTLDPASNRQAEGMGCLETHLGRDALLASYRRVGGKAKDIQSFLRDLRKGTPSAQKIVKRWGEWLTLAIRDLADLFNPKPSLVFRIAIF